MLNDGCGNDLYFIKDQKEAITLPQEEVSCKPTQTVSIIQMENHQCAFLGPKLLPIGLISSFTDQDRTVISDVRL